MLNVNKAQWQHHEQTIYVETKQDHINCQDDALVCKKKLQTIVFGKLGMVTKQEQIPFWKWKRAVLMFRMYLRVHH